MRAQPGIFALGTTEHCYLELDVASTAEAARLVSVLAGVMDELTTTGGVNVTVGFRPSVWAAVAPGAQVPDGVTDWTDDLVGPDGFTMPATPHDAWVWIAGGSRTAVFDCGRLALDRAAGAATVASEMTGWLYRHDRDLTGFIDGTENPSLLDAPAVVIAPSDRPGAGSTVVLYQVWRHDTASWEAQPVSAQEQAMGRTKDDSTEFSDADKPATSHVARTSVEVDGEELDIFRRNVAYGGITDHGTVFVGFSHDQWRMHEMLRRMAGVADGVRDELTRYTVPVSGAYYVVPSVEALADLARG